MLEFRDGHWKQPMTGSRKPGIHLCSVTNSLRVLGQVTLYTLWSTLEHSPWYSVFPFIKWEKLDKDFLHSDGLPSPLENPETLLKESFKGTSNCNSSVNTINTEFLYIRSFWTPFCKIPPYCVCWSSTIEKKKMIATKHISGYHSIHFYE